MKLRHLLLGIFCFIALNNYKSLFAQSTDEVEITILAEHICNLLLQGYSIDYIVKSLDDGKKHSYDIQKLVTHIYEALDKQFSKEAVINSINNQESKKNYTRESFLKKITRTYFTLKTIIYLVCIAVILVICFLLYKYILAWVFGLISRLRAWLLPSFKTPCTSDQGPNNNKLPHTEIPQAPVEQTEKNQDIPMQAIQDALQADQEAFKLVIRQTRTIDRELSAHIAEQFAYAKSIGLEPAAIQFNSIKTNRDTIVIRKKFSELIAEQIANAKSIGLIPTTGLDL